MHFVYFIDLQFSLSNAHMPVIIIGSKILSCKYSMGQKNGLHAFGYNSAESKPIWI